ncbi:MAG: hypothetical protein U0Q07_03695 [Acidimicrobiales bacterium]
MTRWRVVAAAAAVGLMGAATGACSSSSSTASGSSSTTAKPTSGTGSSGGATTGTAQPKAGSASGEVKKIKGASGADIQAKAPLENPTFNAKVQYADPITPDATFTASGTVDGTSLSQLGSWTAKPTGEGSASGGSTTTTSGGATAKPASFSQTPGTAPSSSATPPGDESDLCNGSEQFGCIVYSTGWVRLAADAGTTSSITCPADHPYIQGPWVSSLDPENGVTNWAFDPQWDWARDHWTITVWTLGQSGNGWRFGAQNWNTVFGDAWHYAVYIACGTQQSQPPSQPPPAASPGTTAG